MIKIYRFILLLGTTLLFSHCVSDQNDCEKIFNQALIEAKKEMKKRKLTAAESELYMHNKHEELKINHPNCVPKEFQVMNMPRKSGLKLDSETLTDGQINLINQQYQLAEDKCKEELKDSLKSYSQEDKTRLIHECAMEKLVTFASQYN